MELLLWHWLIEFWRFKEPSRVGGAWCYQLSKGTEAVGMDVTTGYVGRRGEKTQAQARTGRPGTVRRGMSGDREMMEFSGWW